MIGRYDRTLLALLILSAVSLVLGCGAQPENTSNTGGTKATASTIGATTAQAPRPALPATFDPPWNPPPVGGEHFSVPGVDNAPDLHGDPIAASGPDGLVVFESGNQFMVLPKLMEAFQKAHPSVKHIYYETLPPGILFEQTQKGGLVMGNLRLSVKPDIITAGLGRMQEIEKTGTVSPYYTYAENKLALMTYKDNPQHITGLKDLGKPGITISMPNPQYEGVARQIQKAYEKAGGKNLVNTVMDTKTKNGETYLTQIHHRQSPMRIMAQESMVAPVWITEALFQERLNHPVSLVRIPDDENVTATYNIAVFNDAPHKTAAQEFYDFMKTPTAQALYKDYGFIPATQSQLNTPVK